MLRPFTKYEALGNDFIVLDADAWPAVDVTPALARALCDRHRGVGGDGVLWVWFAAAEGRPAGGDVQLVILNADGSRPEMCGNGVRCVAAYAHHRGRLARGATIALGTDAGPRPARLLEADEAAGTANIEVDMGGVRVDPATLVLEPDATGGPRVEVVPADAGNPHAVVLDPVVPEAHAAIVRALEARRDVFPRGVNVEFVENATAGSAPRPFRAPRAASGMDRLDDDDVVAPALALRVRVHERGVGWTLACGTGACAAAAAAVARGRAGAWAGAPVAVLLDGGPLTVALAPDAGTADAWLARMRGPARRVFAGTVDAALARAAGDARG